MINSISLNNIVICKDSEINLSEGFTALTGETGAGKSIIIDALLMALGKKANYDLVMKGADKLTVIVSFDISKNKEAQDFLREQEIDFDNEIIIKRVLRKERKSITLIQGEKFPVAALSKLGALLVNIHDQNSHVLLSNNEYNLKMFDKAISFELLNAVEKAYLDYSEVRDQIKHLEESISHKKQHMELNKFYKAELDEFSPVFNEYENLLQTKKEFSFKEKNIENLSAALSIVDGEQAVSNMIDSSISYLSSIEGIDNIIDPIIEMLQSSSISLSESVADLNRIEFSIDDVSIDDLIDRVDGYQKLSAKHSCSPNDLEELLVSLGEETGSFESEEANLITLKSQLDKRLIKYHAASNCLREARVALADRISNDISLMLPKLKLEHANFKLTYLANNKVTRTGSDDCKLMFSANIGQDLGELGSVASGGELSRIALCIQVCLSRLSKLPTLIFDEVDVGISGEAALVVGKIFKEIGQSTQIMTITHQAQVAAAADYHILVEKTHEGDETYNQIRLLDREEVVSEITRLMVGIHNEDSHNLAVKLIDQFKAA